VTSTAAFFLFATGGIVAAAACTALMFAFADQVVAVTGFDPRLATIPILYALCFRSMIFVQSMCYGYIEKGGVTQLAFWPRVVGSVALLSLGTALHVHRTWLAWLSLAVLAVLSVLAVGWVRRVAALDARAPALQEQPA
jgi:hypothetical protein